LLLVVVLFVFAPAYVTAEIVSLPMSIDFDLLRTLMIEKAYTAPAERASVTAMNEGCNEIWLSNPRLGQERGLVRFQTDINITWGAPLSGNCFSPIYWTGSIVLWQQPVIDEQWQLRFRTQDSMLLDQSGQRAVLVGLVWDLLKTNIHSYLNSIVLSMAPPVDNLKRVIGPEKRNDPLSTAEIFLGSMRPEQPKITDEGLAINILAYIDLPKVPASQPEPVSPEEQERLMALWQTWDSLLVHMINQLSDQQLTDDDRQLLLDTLLSARYDFSEVIGNQQLTTTFIRRQFITAWVSLKPLFLNHLVSGTSDSMIGYMSFFTAADALVSLDKIGPLIGVDISREGFYRLAHMLSHEVLVENGAVNPRLRATLGLDMNEPSQQVEEGPVVPGEVEPEAEPDMWPEPEEILPHDLQDEGDETSGDEDGDSGALNWIDECLPRQNWKMVFGTAEAHAAGVPTIQDVQSWAAELTPADVLLPKVEKVLVKTVNSSKGKLAKVAKNKEWGHHMVQATAWQESCFRQFVVKDKKLTYLLSYNNTSVGIMQVNEKVWRGVYDLQELRWNIEYNSVAGTEILALYLNRYISKQKKSVNFETAAGRKYLATWLYALYNGGPGQLKKFPERSSSGKLYKSEKLFQEKYDLVIGGKWLSKVRCLPAS
jgi:hypothetical protein